MAPARPHLSRRHILIIAAVVVAAILIAILAIFVVPKMFHVYRAPASVGMRYATSAAPSLR